MSNTIQALIEALKGADPSVVRELRNAVSQLPEEAAAVNPCDAGHVWSDNRKSAHGKRINRSCVRCGVLALNTGDHHGELEAEEASADVGAAVAAALGNAPVAAVSEAEPKPVSTRKRRATG